MFRTISVFWRSLPALAFGLCVLLIASRSLANGSWPGVVTTTDDGSGVTPGGSEFGPHGSEEPIPWFTNWFVSGSNGSYFYRAVAGDLQKDDDVLSDADTGIKSATGWKEKSQPAFVPPAQYECPHPNAPNPPTYLASHGAPGDAKVKGTGAGSVECTIVMTPDNGAIFSNGSCYAYAHASVSFAGVAASSCSVDLNDGTFTESGDIGGSFSTSKTPPGTTTTITGSVSTDNGEVATVSGANSCTNTVTSAPMNISGASERGTGYVAVRAAIYNGAEGSRADASSTVSTVDLERVYGGTAIKCEFDAPHSH